MIIAEEGTVLPESCNRLFSTFCYCTSIDLSKADTSKVTDMAGMFYFCSRLTKLDLSNFDTSNVTDMSLMFGNLQILTTLDISSFDTSNVTSMSNMFNNCYSLTSLDLSGFDTSNVTSFYYMFKTCTSLKSLDLSGFDTSNVVQMSRMFEGCYNLQSLDLSSFNTSNLVRKSHNLITGMGSMFCNCKNLNTITLGENFETLSNQAQLLNGNGWVNVKAPKTVISGDGRHAVIENNGTNTYKLNGSFKITYPTDIKWNYSEKYHQLQFTWDKVDGADRYSIAVYQSGKWQSRTQNITGTSYITPKNSITPGKTYKVAIAARVNGKWDTENAIKNAVTITIHMDMDVDGSSKKLFENLDEELNKIMPPIYDENGNKITSESEKCEAAWNYFDAYIWEYLKEDTPAISKYAAYTDWFRETYGVSGIEKFWVQSSNAIGGLYNLGDILCNEIKHLDETMPKAAKQIVFGDYCEDVTVTGTAGQVIISFTGIDFIADLRDVTYDLGHWKFSWKCAGKTAIDIASVLPVIGALKYSDEVKTLCTLSNMDEATLISKKIGDIDDLCKSGKSTDEVYVLTKAKLTNDAYKTKVISKCTNQQKALDFISQAVNNYASYEKKAVELIDKYGEETIDVVMSITSRINQKRCVEYILEYGDDALEILTKHGDEAIKALNNCTNKTEAIKLIKEIGSDAATAIEKNGDEAVNALMDLSTKEERAAKAAELICFVAGTKISTDNGSLPIEEIEVGMTVLSMDPVTGDVSGQKVAEIFENQTDELVTIQVNGEQITSTPSHPFYVYNVGWTAASDLRAGDRLCKVNGEYAVVESIEHQILENPVNVYNFEVEDYHTYFVGENAVLVHNSCDYNFDYVKQFERYTGHPASGHVHHGLPKKHIKWFESKGINIDSGEYYFDLPEELHTLKAGHGVHTNSSYAGKTWDAVWDEFKLYNPNATKEMIEEFLDDMAEEFKITEYRAVKAGG